MDPFLIIYIVPAFLVFIGCFIMQIFDEREYGKVNEFELLDSFVFSFLMGLFWPFILFALILIGIFKLISIPILKLINIGIEDGPSRKTKRL